MAGKDEVDAWFAKTDHPLESSIQRVRQVILETDARVDECIKWQSPTFMFEGNIASFNPRAKKHVSLMFHQGAKIPGTFDGLEGGGDTARYMKFESEDDVDAKADALRSVVSAWIAWKS